MLGRENKDIYYTMPVPSGRCKNGFFAMVALLGLAQLAMRRRLQPCREVVGEIRLWAWMQRPFGFFHLMFGIFNLVFLTGYYKGYQQGGGAVFVGMLATRCLSWSRRRRRTDPIRAGYAT